MQLPLTPQLLILLLIATAEGIFFNRHKKSWNLFSDGKEMKPNVHHYHFYHYPIPLHVKEPVVIGPEKRQLEEDHDEKLKSLGWTDEEYPVPDPNIIYPSKFDSLWKEESPSPYLWDGPIFESPKPKEVKDVSVQVPLHQQIIIQLPKEKEELGFLGSLLERVKKLNKLLFHTSKHEYERRSDHSGFYNYFYYNDRHTKISSR